MKRKILVILISMLLITILATFTTTADICERRPTTNYNRQNSPPDAPIVKIPDKVRIGSWLYIKAISTDPDDDLLYYKYHLFGVDSEWVGPYHSGEEYIKMITIGLEIGSYKLGVQAKDTCNAESDWTYIDFNVVKSRSITSPLINLLQNHPNLFPILRYIFGL